MTEEPTPNPKQKFDKVKFLRRALLYLALEACLIGLCVSLGFSFKPSDAFALFFVVNGIIVILHLIPSDGSGDDGMGCM